MQPLRSLLDLTGATGEEVKEPDVDLSAFLERQRLSAQPSSALLHPDEDEDVDHSLAHVTPTTQTTAPSKKGKVQQVEWDASLEEMRREKAAAEAKWGASWCIFFHM